MILLAWSPNTVCTLSWSILRLFLLWTDFQVQQLSNCSYVMIATGTGGKRSSEITTTTCTIHTETITNRKSRDFISLSLSYCQQKSPRFSFAFAFVMIMLATHKPQQQATITKIDQAPEMILFAFAFVIQQRENPKSRDYHFFTRNQTSMDYLPASLESSETSLCKLLL